MDDDYWTHKDCGQPVLFDLSGAFCLGCHAEGLGEDDVVLPGEAPSTASTQERQETP